MQIANRFLVTVLVLVTFASSFGQQRAVPKGERIILGNEGVSVIRPPKWFVFMGGTLPVFFNLPAEEFPPQGLLPPGGACISLISSALRGDVDQNADAFTSWIELEVKSNRGVSLEKRELMLPRAADGSRSWQISFDKPGLARGSRGIRMILIAWRFRNRFFGAELSYHKEGPKGSQYESTLVKLVESFQPQN